MRATTIPRLLAVAVLSTALTAGTAAAGAEQGTTAQKTTVQKTTVQLSVVGCDGCSFFVHAQVLGRPGVFSTRAKKVRDGRVRFTVPTSRTVGMSIAVVAPFEGATLAISEVVLGYRGQSVGSAVTPAVAAAATRGNVCFAGTSRSRLALDVRVVPVQIRGNEGPVTAAAAFATTTQASLRPSFRTFGGYQGSQGLPVCHG